MKKLLICILPFVFLSCHKDKVETTGCDLQQVYLDNAKKVTIIYGIWGTVSSIEGDCMPMISPSASGCRNCPVKRIVRIYQYTLLNNATASGNSTVFFDSFNTALVAQAETDEDGFFQVNIPPGKYTIAIVEDGKLYANGGDGQGGLSPFTLTGGTQHVNLAMNYKAVF